MHPPLTPKKKKKISNSPQQRAIPHKGFQSDDYQSIIKKIYAKFPRKAS